MPNLLILRILVILLLMPLPKSGHIAVMSTSLLCAAFSTKQIENYSLEQMTYSGEGYYVIEKQPDIVYDWKESRSVLLSPEGVDCTTQVLLDEQDRIIGLGLTSLDKNMVDADLMSDGMFGQKVMYTHDHFELNIDIENEVDSSAALSDQLRAIAAMACQRFYDKVIHKN